MNMKGQNLDFELLGLEEVSSVEDGELKPLIRREPVGLDELDSIGEVVQSLVSEANSLKQRRKEKSYGNPRHFQEKPDVDFEDNGTESLLEVLDDFSLISDGFRRRLIKDFNLGEEE